MTTGKTIALIGWTFVGKVMPLLFNILSRLVIAFLPRSKHLLILWLQSPSAVILEPKKIKSVTVSIVSPSIWHEVMGPNAVILVFWMLSFKANFSLSSFTVVPIIGANLSIVETQNQRNQRSIPAVCCGGSGQGGKPWGVGEGKRGGGEAEQGLNFGEVAAGPPSAEDWPVHHLRSVGRLRMCGGSRRTRDGCWRLDTQIPRSPLWGHFLLA